MRTECRYYESRTYPSGDTVRMCRLDLAPDAPWRCPDDCPSYERKLSGGGWSVGSLVEKPAPKEPESVADGSAASILESAENILNEVGPELAKEFEERRAELRAQEAQAQAKPWWKFW